MIKPSIHYTLKNITTTTTTAGTLTTTGSNLPVADVSKFNPNGGRALILASGLKYEFVYSGISGNNLTNARLIQAGSSVNYSAGSLVFPIFEITLNEYYECNLTWEQDRVVNRFINIGDIVEMMRGYYFVAEVIYDKISISEYSALANLFNAFIDEIFFVINRDNATVKFAVYIAEPHQIEDFRTIAFKNFRIKFRSKKRYEHGYNIDNLSYWGNRATIFNDRTLYRGLRWYDVMIEQNNKDSITNSNIVLLANNLTAHLNATNPHSSLYYTKDEIERKLSVDWLIYSHTINTDDITKDYFYLDDEATAGIISGIECKITKMLWYDTADIFLEFEPNLVISELDKIKFLVV